LDKYICIYMKVIYGLNSTFLILSNHALFCVVKKHDSPRILHHKYHVKTSTRSMTILILLHISLLRYPQNKFEIFLRFSANRKLYAGNLKTSEPRGCIARTRLTTKKFCFVRRIKTELISWIYCTNSTFVKKLNKLMVTKYFDAQREFFENISPNDRV